MIAEDKPFIANMSLNQIKKSKFEEVSFEHYKIEINNQIQQKIKSFKENKLDMVDRKKLISKNLDIQLTDFRNEIQKLAEDTLKLIPADEFLEKINVKLQEISEDFRLCKDDG